MPLELVQRQLREVLGDLGADGLAQPLRHQRAQIAEKLRRRYDDEPLERAALPLLVEQPYDLAGELSLGMARRIGRGLLGVPPLAAAVEGPAGTVAGDLVARQLAADQLAAECGAQRLLWLLELEQARAGGVGHEYPDDRLGHLGSCAISKLSEARRVTRSIERPGPARGRGPDPGCDGE